MAVFNKDIIIIGIGYSKSMTNFFSQKANTLRHHITHLVEFSNFTLISLCYPISSLVISKHIQLHLIVNNQKFLMVSNSEFTKY